MTLTGNEKYELQAMLMNREVITFYSHTKKEEVQKRWLEMVRCLANNQTNINSSLQSLTYLEKEVVSTWKKEPFVYKFRD